MQMEFPGLILDNRLYPIDELPAYCNDRLKDNLVPSWEKEVYSFILELLDNSGSITLKTSGTTGEQKIIQMPKSALYASARLTAKALDLKYGQTALLCLPIKYVAGKMMVVRALVLGLNLKMVEPASMPDFSNFTRIDFCAMVPIQAYNSLSDYQFQTQIDTLLIGGGEIRDELEVKLRELSSKVYESYGMTETCTHVALRRINGPEPEDSFKCLDGVEPEIDERGCLRLKVSFLEKEIETNDLVKLIDKRRFKWFGRLDNIINTGGIKIQAEVLESKIEKIIKLPCALIHQPDPALGQRLILVVEAELNEQKKKDLLIRLRKKIEKKQVPKEVYAIKKLPRNASMKIDRIALRLMIKEING